MSKTSESRLVLRAELLRFYDQAARPLPWRETTDPYLVWVSEVMLQQTRVETAVPYFQRWVERFPTVNALAEAPLESVLEAWAGLGYYSRARNLHRAAAVVRETHDGVLPDSLEALRALPGVGDYTAGAVASIAFQVAAPAVDGNVRRVLSRLFDIAEPTPSVLKAKAAELVDPNRPGDFNQALMELGATVCVPRTPNCEACPVQSRCLARARGTVSERPPAKRTKKVPSVAHGVAVVRFESQDGCSTLLRRRPTTGLLGGMLEFPSVEVTALAELTAGRAPGGDLLSRAFPFLCQAQTTSIAQLDPVPHRFSHLAATYHPFVYDLPSAPKHEVLRRLGLQSLAWQGLGAAALPTAQRRIAAAAEKIVPAWSEP